MEDEYVSRERSTPTNDRAVIRTVEEVSLTGIMLKKGWLN